MSETERDVVWMGDLLNVLQSFPKTVCAGLGSDLRRLRSISDGQNGDEGQCF